MHLSPVYQSIKNQGKPKYVVDNFGPIFCVHDSWLGSGYYFWDGFIQLAHWWGKVHYRDNYIICEADLDFNESDFYDLVGNTAHMKDFIIVMKSIKSKLGLTKITVSGVLAFMRKYSMAFHPKVIRARSEHQIPESENVRFVEDDRGFIKTIPAIQICVTDRNVITSFEEVYRSPELQVI